MSNEPTAARKMPKYRCHLEVWALKIKHVNGNFLVPEDSLYDAIEVTDEWRSKHKPHDGGYYVVYVDGRGFVTAKVFEEGYTRITP